MAWHQVAQTSDLIMRDVIGREVAGRKIAIYRLGDRYYATAGTCTHGAALLSDGEVVDRLIECPAHYGYFDIVTGRAQGAPVSIDLETYPVRINGTAIEVELGD